MELQKCLIEKNIFTLFTAPVGKGKTFAVLDLYRREAFKMIFISPLRALAQEVYEKMEGEKNVYWLGNTKGVNNSRADSCINFLTKKKAILITTVELLEDEYLEIIKLEKEPILFVFDEFHLFYTWGEGFRPILHDKFLGVLNSEHPVIGLSATINEEVMNRLIKDLSFYNPTWIHLDYGNQKLNYTPARMHFFGGHEKRVMDRAFVREMEKKKNTHVYLMFCSLRDEVDRRLNWAKRNGYRAIGCVGGEVEKFQAELKAANGEVDCIFSTVALSHGVNLPEISKVFISYPVKDYDFWLQMVGRGGRQGAHYDVYTFDSYHLKKKEQFIKYISSGFSDWLGIEL